MLNMDTKRKIDSLRSILVGKVPDPKAQVEQITFAWVYKYMSDMDRVSEEMGGNPQFFNNGYQKFAWHKLFDHQLSGYEQVELYAEAIAQMQNNKHIPPLFQAIFKDAVLPYRSPDTLRLFLKEVNDFSFEDTESLGDAYEYLLSILGSQGDAGQFRTPRHIIDFIVECVEPKKGEKILDPACGTAGFLISAFKYIRKSHDGKDNKTGEESSTETPLTPDEKRQLIDHFVGYDISPDMIRMSKVNMYLHGFADPNIYEYDTLSSEDRWDEQFDVMLANPPFMTPKGGIKPHKRFSVQANRAEILFVDYIMEHLRPNGRAGIIVPEGVIFQSATAYKELRRLLIEDGLFAVVSLPSGVFNPYSGVKTSILLFDNALSKKTKNILFVKISNDGFELGAQRRESAGNELPSAIEAIKGYKKYLQETLDIEDVPSIPEVDTNPICHLVPRKKIASNGDYNLAGDRYKKIDNFESKKWTQVKLGEISSLVRGVTYSKNDEVESGGHEVLRANNISLDGELILKDIKLISSRINLKETQRLSKNDIFICLASGSKDHIGKVAYIDSDTNYYFGGFMGVVRISEELAIPKYVFYLLRSQKFNQYLRHAISGSNINNINSTILSNFSIPLPPLEIQLDIVDQIESKQQAISHAKAVIQNLERERENILVNHLEI